MPLSGTDISTNRFEGHSGPKQPGWIVHGTILTRRKTLPCRAAPLAAGYWHHSSIIFSSVYSEKMAGFAAKALSMVDAISSSYSFSLLFVVVPVVVAASCPAGAVLYGLTR
jgi:hypothetical protein